MSTATIVLAALNAFAAGFWCGGAAALKYRFPLIPAALHLALALGFVLVGAQS